PAIALGGRVVRPRPLALVSLIGPTGVFPRHAVLDTGADDTVFPIAAAIGTGIDLTSAPIGDMSGIGGGVTLVRYARATLRMTDGIEFREWSAWVGFTATALKRPILGFAGCLQFFDATFRGEREEVELVTNSHYPGT